MPPPSCQASAVPRVIAVNDQSRTGITLISSQRPSTTRRRPAMGHPNLIRGPAGTLGVVSVYEHVHDVPTEDELRQLVGAATPHFAFQAYERVAKLAAALPPDHPRQPELAAHLEYLERLGYEGETAGDPDPDLPPRPSIGLA